MGQRLQTVCAAGWWFRCGRCVADTTPSNTNGAWRIVLGIPCCPSLVCRPKPRFQN